MKASVAYSLVCRGSTSSEVSHFEDVAILLQVVCLFVCLQGSKYVSHGAESYDIFATSAVTDGIKVWDLRSSR